MLSKSLIQFFTEEWYCVPSLLFTWSQSMVEETLSGSLVGEPKVTHSRVYRNQAGTQMSKVFPQITIGTGRPNGA